LTDKTYLTAKNAKKIQEKNFALLAFFAVKISFVSNQDKNLRLSVSEAAKSVYKN